MENLLNHYFNAVIRTFEEDSSRSVVGVTTRFYPPKLALVAGTRVRIVDVEAEAADDVVYDTSSRVRFVHLYKHFLWVALDAPQVIIYDLLKCASLVINFLNGSFHVRKIRRRNEEIIFISESGDCFSSSVPMSDLMGAMKPNEEVSIDTNFVKVRCNMVSLETDDHHVGGTSLSLTLESSNTLRTECRVTKLKSTINFPYDISGLATFHDDDRIILLLGEKSNDLSSLVLTRLGDSHVETRVESEVACQPVGGIGDAFYYVSANEERICVHCVKRQEPLHVAHALASCGKYDEAHDYALKNHLDVEPLLKMKVTGMVDSALSGESVDCSIFCEIFEQISDQEFLIDQTATLCQYCVEYKPLLMYLSSKTTDYGEHKIKLLETLAKVDILEFLDSHSGCDYISHSNIFEKSLEDLCLLFVSMGDVDLASVVWLKHCSIVKHVNPDVAMAILNETPHQIKLNSLMVWLKILIPSVLYEIPFFVDTVAKWVVERIFLLEKSKYWPDIGIKFAVEVLGVLEESRSGTPTPVCPPSLDTLRLITLHMNNIKLLKDKYRINLLVRELMVENANEIVKIILHRCYTEDLRRLIEEFLPSYMSRHGLDHDMLLREYVERLLETEGVDDSRLPLVVQALCSDEQRVSCILHVVQNVEVPWSENVFQLAVEASASDHEFSQQIKTQLKHAKLKMVLKKYNFPMTWTNYETVLAKVVSSPSVELEDMKTVVEVAGRLREHASLMYVTRCLGSSMVRAALAYCKDLNVSEKRTISRATMIYYESLLMDETGDQSTERNYLDFIKGVGLLNDSQLNRICKMYHLKKSYGIRLSANDYCIESVRMDQFESWCRSNGPFLDPNVYYLKSMNLATLLSVDSQIAIPSILSYVNDECYESTLQAMLRNSDDFPIDKLIKNIDLKLFLDGKHTDMLRDYIQMFTVFVSNCKEELLHRSVAALSILTSIKNCNYFVNNSSIAWKFHYIFMPVSTYSSANDLILFYEKCHNQDMDTLVNSIAVRNDLVPLRIISEITSLYMRDFKPTSEDYLNMREKIAKKMLSKIVMSQHCDEILATALLNMIPAPDDWLRDLYDSQNSENINKSYFLEFMVQAEKVLHFRDLVPHSANGYQQLLKSKHNLDITNVTRSEEIDETTNMKVVVYNILKANTNIGFECLQDVCRTFNMSLQHGLTLQILALIDTFVLNYQIYKDSLGITQVEIRSSENDFLSTCSILIESIKSKEFLVDSLKELWINGELSLGGQTVSINPYHYEAFIGIYHILSRLVPDWRAVKEYLLLQFLKEYRRVSSPRQTEMDVFSVKGSFPEIGFYRLPFHLFTKDDMWLNLKYEITLKSYIRWLPIVTILGLDKDLQTAQDMICSNAVKQTMTLRKQSNDSALEPWKLYVTNESLLKQAHECVQHISNMEWAAACLFFVLQGSKRGADQLAAAELIYNFAQHWAKLQPNNNVVKKMQYKYCTLSTMHVLHKMGYTDDRFLQLCTDPGLLIRTLYADKSYTEKMLEFDVNKAVDEIADKNSVNINLIRYQILENVLDQKSKRVGDSTAVGLEKSEVTRARYILKATCPSIGAMYLVRIGLDTDSDFNKTKKLRALQCLMSVVDPDVLLKISSLERSTLQSALLDLYFSIELERIDMPFLVATFVEDKQRALRQIWQSGEKTADMVRVIAQMGSVYTLSEDIVQELLPALISCELVDELAHLLPRLNCAHTEVLCRAWSKVLLTPFEKADYPVSDRQRSSCLRVVNLLPTCPLVKQSDLETIWNNCARCKCMEIGCLVLPYVSEKQRSTLTDWSKVDKRNLIAGIKNLHVQTFLVIAAMSVVDSMTSRRL